MAAARVVSERMVLTHLRDERKQISVFLINGIRLRGRIDVLDESVIHLKDGGTTLMVYKHAIASIMWDGERSKAKEESA
jgi:RNA chaperone Hfq